jgi:hypothetical protein
MRHHIDKAEARQGVTGHGVRYVLAASLGVTLVALLVVYLGSA